MLKDYTFSTSCIEADGDDINEMRDHAKQREVTYRTMLQHCEGLLEWAVEHDYSLRCNQVHGVTLRNDWSVSYHRSWYRGEPCFYLCWSAIEFIWVQAKEG